METRAERVKGLAFSRGVNSLWGARVVLTREFHAARQAVRGDEEDEEFDAEAAFEREQALAAEHWVLPVPAWQQISGLYPRADMQISPNERAGRMRKLLRQVERMVRFELRNGEANCRTRPQHRDPELAEAAERAERDRRGDAETRESGDLIERTVLWNPVRTVCFYLEIAPRRLSALCRELTGMAIQELVDRIRAESLRKELRGRLKAFVCEVAARVREGARDVAEWAEQVYGELKRSRRDPRWHRTTWAAGLGFSSYQRLFRSTLLWEGLTPHQVELAVIEELLSASPAGRNVCPTVCVGGQTELGTTKSTKVHVEQHEDGGMKKEVCGRSSCSS